MLPDKLVMAGIFVLIFVTDYNILAPLDKKKVQKILGPKWIKVQKNFWSEKFCPKKILGKKKFEAQK